MKVLVTGGCGFIGSHFVRHVLSRDADVRVVNVDALTYAGSMENVAGITARHTFVHADIADAERMEKLFVREGFEGVVNFAAESHVDRSIRTPQPFVHTNLMGCAVLLDAARRHGVRRFVQISSDEVYGSAGEGRFTEESPLKPSSPYSASKAGADLLALAYWKTYGMEVMVTRCSNNYGARQFPEKLIPLMISKALRDERLPVYGDGRHVRDWIHVEDHCRVVYEVLRRGEAGEVYNVGGGCELENIEVVRMILRELGKPESLIQFVADRPGHDRRYAMDSGKIERTLGWRPQRRFEEGLRETIKWYAAR